MRKNIQKEILNLIETKLATDVFSDLEKYALQTLKSRLSANQLNEEEAMLLVNDFISNYFEFDKISSDPVAPTPELEDMVDYLMAKYVH